MRISIVTVCLNRVNTIEKTIQSVINQNYSEIEYIIIDGRSSDGTVDIIKKYESYLACWVSETDKGIYDAMNKGLAKSTGEIIAFLNSDDWYEENTLVKVNRYFEQYNPMILAGRVNTLQKGKWTKYIGSLDGDKENIRMAMIYKQPAMFVHRGVFDRTGGFNTCYKVAADFEWMLRVHDSGMRVMCVEDVFTNFSSTGISNTNMDLTISEAREIATEALNRCEQYSREERENWRIKINKCYDEQQARTDVKRIIRGRQLTEFSSLKISMLEYFKEPSYVVWGIGVIGDDMYNLLTQLTLEVDYFVDRRSVGTAQMFRDRKVIHPHELVHGKKVIIATLEYEDEIANQMIEMGFQEDKDYILYSTILQKLIEIYEKYYIRYGVRSQK